MGRRLYQEAKTELMATQAASETLQGEVSRAETGRRCVGSPRPLRGDHVTNRSNGGANDGNGGNGWNAREPTAVTTVPAVTVNVAL